MKIPVMLSFKEMWRNRGRFLLFSLVIALITLLVLFIAALADGLGNGNREYIQKLNGDLVVFKSNVDLSIGASQLARAKLTEVKRVSGVKDVGQVNFTSVVLLLDDSKKLNVAVIGVEPGKPGNLQPFREASLDRKQVVGPFLIAMWRCGQTIKLAMRLRSRRFKTPRNNFTS